MENMEAGRGGRLPLQGCIIGMGLLGRIEQLGEGTAGYRYGASLCYGFNLTRDVARMGIEGD